ncbi:MAG: hypothetical protein AABW89_05200 [Nanoarchaeota archaeon]
MIKYEDLYEILRREKINDPLQKMPSDFMKDFSELIHEKKNTITNNGNFFSDEIMKDKKQYENLMILFKELMLRRKKKLLNLVFIANETSIMKKDFENMLSFEKDLFDILLHSVEQTDKLISMLLLNGHSENTDKKNILIIDDVESFIGVNGELIGPFTKGQTVSIDKRTADILVSGQKAVSV